MFTAPELTWAAQLELVVSLALTVLFVQNGQGIAVLLTAGHRPPLNVFAVVSDAFSILHAGFAAVSACVGPTRPIDIFENQGAPTQRAVVSGGLVLVCAVLAPTLTRLILAAPTEFVLPLESSQCCGLSSRPL
ncbi:benzoate/H(+) symporter BenE family transporter [Paenarthrobacter sp. NPDC091669]|uniref:benzoate/H(+) symporter BenE family transporter n=1 Tax=Paenarthrobacter sp. NPDC091669 TaxID=3364384 RepID=UPI0037F84010